MRFGAIGVYNQGPELREVTKGRCRVHPVGGKKKTNLAQGLRISVELCNSDLRPEEHGVCPRDYAGPRPVSTDYRG